MTANCCEGTRPSEGTAVPGWALAAGRTGMPPYRVGVLAPLLGCITGIGLGVAYAAAHGRHDRGRAGERRRHRPVMQGFLHRSEPSLGVVAVGRSPPPDDAERTRLFREAALPHLDDVYTLARYLLRNAADADDAVQ